MLRRLARPATSVVQQSIRSNARLVSSQAYDQPLQNSMMRDVHGTAHGKKSWRNNPLFRRAGDQKFRTGAEACTMLMNEAKRRDPYQHVFLQAVESMVTSLAPVFDRYPKYAWIMKQLLEPERVIQFRVGWVDDEGIARVNRGFRVQYSSALGPYAGYLRFHPSTGHGAVKFLGFNNIFSNALTEGLGAAAGGSDFNPAGKSEREVQRFCMSFMTELQKYIGPSTDLPSGGVGCGVRELGYLYGQYRRIANVHSPPGRGLLWGGRHLGPSAVGHGVAYFADEVVRSRGETLLGKRVLLTGSGMVALFAAEKLIELGAIPITFSDSAGFVVEEGGFSPQNLRALVKLKSERGARVGGYIMTSTSAQYNPTPSVFSVPCDVAIPCALQNQIGEEEAMQLVEGGCRFVIEGANMPSTPEAMKVLTKRGVVIGPSSAATSGAALVNGLAAGGDAPINAEELDELLRNSMANVLATVEAAAAEYNAPGDLVAGANIASFTKVAEVMLGQGSV